MPSEFAQATQCHLEIARTQLATIIEVAILTRFPHFDGSALALALIADANTLRIVATRTEGRSTAGANPLVAARVTLFLLFQALAQGLEQLVPTAESLRLGALLFCKKPLGHHLQPFSRNLCDDLLKYALGTREMLCEHAIETIKMPLILHERQPGKPIELFGGTISDPRFQSLQQREQLGDRHRNARCP